MHNIGEAQTWQWQWSKEYSLFTVFGVGGWGVGGVLKVGCAKCCTAKEDRNVLSPSEELKAVLPPHYRMPTMRMMTLIPFSLIFVSTSSSSWMNRTIPVLHSRHVLSDHSVFHFGLQQEFLFIHICHQSIKGAFIKCVIQWIRHDLRPVGAASGKLVPLIESQVCFDYL